MRLLTLALVLSAGLAAPGAQTAAPGSQESPYYFFILGRHLEGEGKLPDAIAAHKQAISLAPDSAELRAELAGLYARNDRAGEAFETAQEAIARDPENQEANRVLGTIYAALAEQRQAIRAGDNVAEYPAKAIVALEKARRGNTGDLNVELMLGRLYAQTGAFDKAVPLLRRVVDEQPGYQEGALLLATTQESAGQSEDAIQTLERTLEMNPGFYRGQLRLADIYERLQKWPQAAEALGKAQTLNARNPALTPRRAIALINAGRGAEARKMLEALAPAGGRTDPAVLYLLAEAQRADRDLDAAEATARKLLDTDAKDVRGLHVLSLIQQDRGDFKGAEGTLRALLTEAPEDANALNSLGYLLAERGERLDEAVQLLQRALKIDPDNPSFLDSLGWAYYQQGRFAEADAPLTAAASKLQASSVVQEHLGDLRFKQQRFADAATAWERALAGDGQSVDRARIEKKIRDVRARMEQR